MKHNQLETFAASNHPKSQDVVNKYLEKYRKAWGDPNNTPADNAFLELEARKEAVNDPELFEAYEQAFTEFRKIQSEKNEEIAKDLGSLAVSKEGMLVERKDELEVDNA